MKVKNQEAVLKLEYEVGLIANNISEFKQVVRKLDLTKQVSNIGTTPSLLRCAMQNEELTTSEIALLILDAQKFYNVKNALDEDMLFEVAGLVLSEYKHFNMYDIALCLKNGKLGRYGKIYERLDGGTIMDWFTQYNKKREDLIIMNAETQHSQTKFTGTRTTEALPFADKINKLK
jgi:hypothetical protein